MRELYQSIVASFTADDSGLKVGGHILSQMIIMPQKYIKVAERNYLIREGEERTTHKKQPQTRKNTQN